MTSLRKQARRKLKSSGFTGDQAGMAWYNQLDALRKNSDLRGKDLRQQAYNNIVGTNRPIMQEKFVMPKPTQLPILVDRPQRVIEVPQEPQVVKSVVKPTTFSQAFRDARNQGLKVFDWNGNKYTTELNEKQLTSDGGEIAPTIVVASRQTPKTNPNQIIVRGIDKELVGQTAAVVRSKRPPEVYRGKGIKYADEVIRRKEGKTGK